MLFGGATAFYSIFWIYYAPQGGATKIGAEFTYSLRSHALRVTRVVPGQNAEQAGLRAGDEIGAINNAKLDTLTPYFEAGDQPGALALVESWDQRAAVLDEYLARVMQMWRARTGGCEHDVLSALANARPPARSQRTPST